MYVEFHVPPQCPSDFSEATLGVGFENTKAGVLELVDEVDSKSIASDGVRVRVPPPAPNIPPTLDATSRKARGIGLCGVFEGQNFIGQTTNVKTGFLATGGIRTRDMGSLKKGAAP